MIRRREFIAGLGSAALWPVVARAQQAAVPVIGYRGARGPIRSCGASFRREFSDLFER
jgi:hypothetical protein